MRFSIKHLLLVMFISALAAIAYQGYSTQVRLQAELVETVAKQSAVESRAMQMRQTIANLRYHSEYVDQLELAAAEVTDAFADVIERYGAIEPQADRVVMRALPVMPTASDYSIRHIRLAIPDLPVFIRTGIAQGLESSNRVSLDSVDWKNRAPTTAPATFQTKLSPGIHELIISMKRSEPSEIELQLDNQRLEYSLFPTTAFSVGGGWSSPSGRTPFAFSVADRTRQLMQIDLEVEGQDDYEFWIWLSSEPSVVGFIDFQRESITEEPNDEQ